MLDWLSASAISVELAGGVRVPLARGRVVVTAEGALFAQTTADPGLALDGGYGGGSTAWRLGVEAGSRATRVGWQYRADTNSGVFLGNYVPPPGATVRLRYAYARP